MQGGGQQGGGPGPGGPGGPAALLSNDEKNKIEEKIRIGNIFFSIVILCYITKIKTFIVEMLKKYKQYSESPRMACGQAFYITFAR